MSGISWTLTGNSGTDGAKDFIGTSDNEPLVVKTNGAQRALLDTSGNIALTGQLGIGTNTPRSGLELQASAAGTLGPILTLTNSLSTGVGSASGSAVAIDLNTYPPPPSSAATVPVGGTPLPGGPGVTTESAVTDQTLTLPKIVRTTYNPSARIEAISSASENFATDIVLLSNKPGNSDNGLIERMRVTPAGVGIGTASPLAPLHLASPVLSNRNLPVALIEANSETSASPRLGLVDTSQGTNEAAPVWYIDNSKDTFRVFRQPNASTGGNAFLTIDNNGLISVAGDIVLTGADCAEHFGVTGSNPPEPGTVLIIDKEGTLRESCGAYDKKVAGVVSGAGEYRHAILLDGKPSDGIRVPLALTGKVYCKVDAHYSPIEVGDLLTTSATPGHAMRATEVAKAFGSVIGKALRGLEVGRGLIPILVSLQ